MKRLLCYNQEEISPEQLHKMLTEQREETFLQCGDVYIEFRDGAAKASMIIAYDAALGFYLHYMNETEKTEALSLWDQNRLEDVVEYDVDCLASAGLFVPVERALAEIMQFAGTGRVLNQIQWIGPDKVPENGNY